MYFKSEAYQCKFSVINTVTSLHLYERDCSIQRRRKSSRNCAINSIRKIYAIEFVAAVRLMKNVNYINAGTVEFLVAGDEFYFIEVNPPIQVERYDYRNVTGIDIVHAQINVAAGFNLHSKLLFPHRTIFHYSDLPFNRALRQKIL